MQQAEEYEFSDSISNDLRSIAGMLDHYDRHSGVLGYTGLAIVLEPSGRHEQKLTRLAHDRGHSIWMVNPERMYKAGVIHHGDDGKSDAQDGKVLFMMARMGKVSRFEPLEGSWQQLRQLGWWLEDSSLAATDARVRLDLLEIIEDRHRSMSTIIASQLPVASWYDVIGDQTIADAILDRLIHTSHRIELKGESMRKNL